MARPPRLARIYSGTARNLAQLAGVLRRGGLVAVPTETVYGLAADALDARACAGIYRAKGRPSTNPLIVHIADLAALEDLACTNEASHRLAAAFWPGPLTLVLPKRKEVPDLVSAGLPSVAVRLPAHPLFRRLLRLTGRPLAAPSANPSGYVSPTTAEHVRAGLGTRIRHILDGGPCPVGLESTIVDVRDPRRPCLLRPGAISRAELETVLGRPVHVRTVVAGEETPQLAPGQLRRHYSPRTPITLHARLAPDAARTGTPREAWVFLSRPPGRRRSNVYWFDVRGDLRGVARRLFAVLRHLDAAGYRRLHLELAPDTDGLSHAINDRLQRAASRG
ncbi:MAG: threonylcarbamoyl-AMP synthase [Verrucomicrobia bacterium]|nr:threonylcarbamoyl-AMP synthase [Verrucomicrobiota bacterium]